LDGFFFLPVQSKKFFESEQQISLVWPVAVRPQWPVIQGCIMGGEGVSSGGCGRRRAVLAAVS